MSAAAKKEVTIPGQYGQGEYVFGDVCPDTVASVPTAVWRYLKDSEGNQTSYIRRASGRPVGEIATDLEKVIRRYSYEWATLGQPFKYSVGSLDAKSPASKLSPTSECPDHNGLAVYVTHGGSEGHLVNVDLRLPNPEYSGEPTIRHLTLFMVKTFAGAAGAKRIADKLAKALGVY